MENEAGPFQQTAGRLFAVPAALCYNGASMGESRASNPPAEGRPPAPLEGAALALLSILLYLPALKFAFLRDDFLLIVQNPRIQSWPGFWEAICQPFFAFPAHPYLHYWRPFTLFTYAVDHSAWGLAPWGYHLINLLLYAACVVLFWLILKRFSPQSPVPLVAAILFLVHPAHVENVAWIAARTDLLVFLLLALSFHFYRGFSCRPERPWRRWLALLLFAAALLSKESAIFFPLLLLFAQGRKPFRQRLAGLLPYAAVILAYLPLHQLAASSLALANRPGWEDVRLAVASAGALVRMLLSPLLPGPHFAMGELAAASPLYYALAALGLLAIAGIVLLRAHFPLTIRALPLLFFLLPLLLPRFVPTYPPIAPRLVFLATPLAAIFLAEAIAWLRRGKLKIAAFILLLLFAVSWTLSTRAQLPLFRDERTYFQGMAARYPGEESFTIQLALREARDGRVPAALALLEKGLAQNQANSWIDYSRNGRIFRANLLIVSGRLDEGEKEIDALLATRAAPEEGYFMNLVKAIARKRRGDLAGALQALGRAAEYGKTAELMLQKAEVLARLGQFPEAAAAVEEALRLGLDRERARRLQEFLAGSLGGQARRRSP